MCVCVCVCVCVYWFYLLNSFICTKMQASPERCMDSNKNDKITPLIV